MWADLVARGGPDRVPPGDLRELSIYGGAQGVWVDVNRTRDISNDGCGIAVAVLHNGSSYPDDLTSQSVRYHYPRTQRPARRDTSEIDAMKNAKRFDLPVFVIVRRGRSAHRDVTLGWVTDWNDDAEFVTIVFDRSRDDAFLARFSVPSNQ